MITYNIYLSDGPPSKVTTIRRCDIDRIYSEYVKTTLKTAEGGSLKSQCAAKSSKTDTVCNQEKTKRKYRKRLKEHQPHQSSNVSLLKPLNQAQHGKLKDPRLAGMNIIDTPIRP